MFGVTAVPSLLFFLVGMFFVPESPRWLAKNGQIRAARAACWRRSAATPYASCAFDEIEATLRQRDRASGFRVNCSSRG